MASAPTPLRKPTIKVNRTGKNAGNTAGMNTNPRQFRASRLDADKESHDAFWIRLLLIAMIVLLVGSAFLFNSLRGESSDDAKQQEDAYVHLGVRTSVGEHRTLIVKVALLTDVYSEPVLQGYKTQLQSVIAATLVQTYDENNALPDLPSLRETITHAVKKRLPHDLQPRDVLLQDAILGS